MLVGGGFLAQKFNRTPTTLLLNLEKNVSTKHVSCHVAKPMFVTIYFNSLIKKSKIVFETLLCTTFLSTDTSSLKIIGASFFRSDYDAVTTLCGSTVYIFHQSYRN